MKRIGKSRNPNSSGSQGGKKKTGKKGLKGTRGQNEYKTKAFVEKRKYADDAPRKAVQKDAPEEPKADQKFDNIRLNKFIANAGICSRREADTLIASGAVEVNGVVCTEMGTKVSHSDVVHYGGQRIQGEKPVYILINKPKDAISTVSDPQGRRTVIDLVGNACKERIYPVGRLDRNTTGLLMLTNDGDLTKKLTHPSHGAKKIYHLHLDKPVSEDDLAQLTKSVTLDDGDVVKADVAEYTEGGNGRMEIGIELHSGKNRVIRRMMEALGYEVMKLDRVMFAGLTKKNLPRGKYRFLNEKEIGKLRMALGKKR